MYWMWRLPELPLLSTISALRRRHSFDRMRWDMVVSAVTTPAGGRGARKHLPSCKALQLHRNNVGLIGSAHSFIHVVTGSLSDSNVRWALSLTAELPSQYPLYPPVRWTTSKKMPLAIAGVKKW